MIGPSGVSNGGRRATVLRHAVPELDRASWRLGAPHAEGLCWARLVMDVGPWVPWAPRNCPRCEAAIAGDVAWAAEVGVTVEAA